MVKKLFVLVVVLMPFVLSAQDSNLGNWLIYFGNKKIDSKFNWHHEVQYRNYNAVGDLEQLLLRTGLGYNLSPNNNNVLLGYGYILSQNYRDGLDDKVDVNEHRIFQQFISRQSFGPVSFQHRYRFEQRWIESDFKMRFRYFLSLNMVLNRAQMEDGAVYLSAYNEIFINDRGTLFDRNRLYGGVGYRLSERFRFEAGYMNQFLNANNRDQVNLIVFYNF